MQPAFPSRKPACSSAQRAQRTLQDALEQAGPEVRLVAVPGPVDGVGLCRQTKRNKDNRMRAGCASRLFAGEFGRAAARCGYLQQHSTPPQLLYSQTVQAASRLQPLPPTGRAAAHSCVQIGHGARQHANGEDHPKNDEGNDGQAAQDALQ